MPSASFKIMLLLSLEAYSGLRALVFEAAFVTYHERRPKMAKLGQHFLQFCVGLLFRGLAAFRNVLHMSLRSINRL